MDVFVKREENDTFSPKTYNNTNYLQCDLKLIQYLLNKAHNANTDSDIKMANNLFRIDHKMENNLCELKIFLTKIEQEYNENKDNLKSKIIKFKTNKQLQFEIEILKDKQQKEWSIKQKKRLLTEEEVRNALDSLPDFKEEDDIDSVKEEEDEMYEIKEEVYETEECCVWVNENQIYEDTCLLTVNTEDNVIKK